MKKIETNSQRDRTKLPDFDGLPASVTRSLSLLKKVTAIAGYKLGHVPQDVAAVIIGAVNDLLEKEDCGKERQAMAILGDEALLNVAVNEKIVEAAKNAKLTREGRKIAIQPEEHLDLGKHSVCTLSNAIRIALVLETYGTILPMLRSQAVALREKARNTASGTQNGRDWAAQFEKASTDIERAVSSQRVLGPQSFPSEANDAGKLGSFGNICMTYLVSVTGQPFSFVTDALAPMTVIDEFFKLSSALNSHSMNLLLITHRMRWQAEENESHSAGKLAGAADKCDTGHREILRLSDSLSLQCVQMLGADAMLSITGRQGYFDSNFHITVMAHCLLSSLRLLVDAHHLFGEYLEKFDAIDTEAAAEKIDKSVRASEPWYALERHTDREETIF